MGPLLEAERPALVPADVIDSGGEPPRWDRRSAPVRTLGMVLSGLAALAVVAAIAFGPLAGGDGTDAADDPEASVTSSTPAPQDPSAAESGGTDRADAGAAGADQPGGPALEVDVDGTDTGEPPAAEASTSTVAATPSTLDPSSTDGSMPAATDGGSMTDTSAPSSSTVTTRGSTTASTTARTGDGAPGSTTPTTARTSTPTTARTSTSARPGTTAAPAPSPTTGMPGHGPGRWVTVGSESASYRDSTVGVTHHLFDPYSANAPAGWGASRIGFVVHCEPVLVRQIDPIVNPGSDRSHHLHQFFGNPNVDPNTTTQSLADTPRSQIQCTDTNDKSAYWTPTAYQNGRLVAPVHFKAYYKSQTPDTEPIPFGLRMIAGNAMATTNQPARVGWWQTSESNTTAGGNRMVSRPNANAKLTLRINYPNCWDGRHLDSPDHQSHMAYASGNRCPASHPVKIAQVTTFTDYAVAGGSGFELASGGWFTFHQDFWNAWSPDQMEELNRRCILAELNCRAKRSPDLVPRGQYPATIG